MVDIGAHHAYRRNCGRGPARNRKAGKMFTVQLHEAYVTEALDAVRDCDVEIEPRFGYSGRFMYGAKCFGVVTSPAGGQLFVAMLLQVLRDHDENGVAEDFVVAVTRGESDSMGLDKIFYWRDVTVELATEEV